MVTRAPGAPHLFQDPTLVRVTRDQSETRTWVSLTNRNGLPIGLIRIPSEVMPTEDIQLQQQLDCGKQKQMGQIYVHKR